MGSTYLIASALYLPHVGGVEMYTRHLAEKLVEAGERVIVVTSELPGAPPREIDGSGAEVVRLPSRQLLGGRFPVLRKGAALDEAASWLAAQKPDHVVVNTRFYPLSLFSARFARELGVAPVVIEHGSAHLTLGNALADRVVEAVEHRTTRRILAFGGDYYGVSRACCAWLGHFGIEARGVLPNAIDAEAFASRSSRRNVRRELGIDDEAFLVGFTGRLAPEKGPERLAAAVRIANDRRAAVGLAPIEAAFAGDGPLRKTVADAGGSRAHLLGRLDSPDIAALLASCDAFCLPTRSEGFSTSLLEAAAMGCAPVMPDVGGVAELMGDGAGGGQTADGPFSVRGCGIVIADREEETVASALETLAADPALARSLGAAAASAVRERCTWDATASAVRAACERAGDRAKA